VRENTKKVSLNQQINAFTTPNSTVNTDEWQGYNDVKKQRQHNTVCHAEKEYARDDDGDGIREVHTNTIEGIWTGLRNFLRIFRGVHKKYLHLYCASFELKHNYKIVAPKILQANAFLNRVLTI
jgi:transposase-like protein